jgi:hypothetical protein
MENEEENYCDDYDYTKEQVMNNLSKCKKLLF